MIVHGPRMVLPRGSGAKIGDISYDEVKQLTRAVVESVGGDGISIASTGFWELEQVLDYVRFAEQLGASAAQVAMPRGASDDAVVRFYQEVAQRTRLGIVLHGDYSAELLHRLVEIDAIVALKEDVGLEYLIKRQIEFGDRLTIFPGGYESRMLVAYPYGARAYYSVFYQFSPELGKQFWHAIRSGDVRAAGQFVAKYEYPFTKRWSRPLWMGTIEHFGIAQRYLRPPEKTLSDEEMSELKAFWDSLGVRPTEKSPARTEVFER